MTNDRTLDIKIEIIEDESEKREFISCIRTEKRSAIQFKCPVCKETIILKCEIPENICNFPYRIEYPHNDHILLIDLDNNHEIREIKSK
ncbi:MAG: hypothetical protein ACTSRP_09030 [Candidatus Helarchaeota archaeon]